VDEGNDETEKLYNDGGGPRAETPGFWGKVQILQNNNMEMHVQAESSLSFTRSGYGTRSSANGGNE